MDVIKVIFANIIGFDLIIIILGLVNVFIVYRLLNETVEEIKKNINPVKYYSVEKLYEHFKVKKNKSKIDLHMLEKLNDRENRLYNIFISITTIFPLMGILGTILSLMRMASFSIVEVTSNFLLALTSTFWGLVFAIVCKVFEGMISSKVEFNEKHMNILLKLDNIGESHEKNIDH